ncbi:MULTISPECIES: hypothetical protein [unclassified Bradyrhizobium]|uniref:hypothetical protein n=1 Tax=unclassified Bradyrhizobium TaxID=2631580 RepID=UPI0028E19C40|nr:MULTISPECIES: hypothetical protein [unclassified Bradyrhizobium]
MVRIIPSLPSSPSFVMPSPDQLIELSSLVYRLRPDFDLRQDRDQRHLRHDHEFASAFRMLGALGRTEQVDHGKALTYWCDVVREALCEYCGIIVEVPANILAAAALAHGDIQYARNGLGLRWFEVGRPAGDAWRSLLETGKVLPPSEQVTSSRPGRVTIDLNVARDHVGFVGSVVR